ncbi:hypothetical protein [Clostridium culturomicium]|uniref:hypothetical protein n=1 Tax=Clostridium culturomicium TaxID=1499683 RepID=UPI00058AC0FD|nr:hypothetical protein [Clostridium culturomicium]
MPNEKSTEKTKQKLKNKLETLLNDVYMNFTLIKDLHEAAYKLNHEYKKFWDKHPEKTKRELLKSQQDIEIPNCTNKYSEMIFGINKVGFFYGVKRLFTPGKLSSEEKIKIAVTADKFTNTLKSINKSLWVK